MKFLGTFFYITIFNMHLFILDLHSIMFCFTVACELPLHLGDIVKSRRERGKREETRTQGSGGGNREF